MAYTLRNVDRNSHTPSKEKLLNGDLNKGIGSVKKIVQKHNEDKAKILAAQKSLEEKVA